MNHPPLPIELGRVLLDDNGVQHTFISPSGAEENLPADVLIHAIEIAKIVFADGRISALRVTIGPRTVVVYVEELRDRRLVLATDVTTGSAFMKSIRRWSSRWFKQFTKLYPYPVPAEEAGAA